MEQGDEVWSVSGKYKGSSGEVVSVDGTSVTVDWYMRQVATVPLDTLQPEVWLRLDCCDVGRRVRAAWLETRTDGTTLVTDRSPQKPGEAAYVLCVPRSIFGTDQEAVLIRFCPGCGAKAPELERREEPTSFHRGPYDANGNCKTCKVRYCSGEDPSRAWRVKNTGGLK